MHSSPSSPNLTNQYCNKEVLLCSNIHATHTHTHSLTTHMQTVRASCKAESWVKHMLLCFNVRVPHVTPLVTIVWFMSAATPQITPLVKMCCDDSKTLFTFWEILFSLEQSVHVGKSIYTLKAYSLVWNIPNIAGRNLNREPNTTGRCHDSSTCDIFTWTFPISPTNHHLMSCCLHGHWHVFYDTL